MPLIDANGRAYEDPTPQMIIVPEPLGDRVVIREFSSEALTKGGLHIADTAREAPQAGVVCFVGPGRVNELGELIPMTLAVGDVVLYGKFSGTPVVINREPFLIARESDAFTRLGRREETPEEVQARLDAFAAYQASVRAEAAVVEERDRLAEERRNTPEPTVFFDTVERQASLEQAPEVELEPVGG